MLSRLCGCVWPSPALVTQNVARATGAAGPPQNARLLESKERSAGQLGRDPADARDISPAHLATSCGKPERLLLYRRQANSPRQHGAVDGLDEARTNPKLRLEAAQGGMVGDQLVTNPGPKSQIGHSGDSEVPDSIGGPSRTRTLDPLIKSQLLYQLS
jgi:hypothetical protein